MGGGMRLFSIFLALVAVFVGGFVFALWCIICTIERHFPMAWKNLVLEAKEHKQRREEAREEE